MTYQCPKCDISEVGVKEDGTVSRHSLHIRDSDTGFIYTYRSICDGEGETPVSVTG